MGLIQAVRTLRSTGFDRDELQRQIWDPPALAQVVSGRASSARRMENGESSCAHVAEKSDTDEGSFPSLQARL